MMTTSMASQPLQFGNVYTHHNGQWLDLTNHAKPISAKELQTHLANLPADEVQAHAIEAQQARFNDDTTQSGHTEDSFQRIVITTEEDTTQVNKAIEHGKILNQLLSWFAPLGIQDLQTVTYRIEPNVDQFLKEAAHA